MKTYRFKITSKTNQSTLGTGSFKTHREFSEKEQLDFFHQYTSGRYVNQDNFVSIEIKEEKPAG